jgi:hypothetical protein
MPSLILVRDCHIDLVIDLMSVRGAMCSCFELCSVRPFALDTAMLALAAN